MEIAQDQAPKNNDKAIRQYLTFHIGGEEYAANLLRVKEIIEYDTITKVPKTPEWIRGVINLRGSVVPVVDLAVKFKQPPSEIGKLSCIVIAEVEPDSEAAIIGVMADSVSQVIELRDEEIEPPPNFGTRVKIDYLQGMARSGKKFCLLLDTDKILSVDDLLDMNACIETTAASSDEVSVSGDQGTPPENAGDATE